MFASPVTKFNPSCSIKVSILTELFYFLDFVLVSEVYLFALFIWYKLRFGHFVDHIDRISIDKQYTFEGTPIPIFRNHVFDMSVFLI